ncbi:MAG: flagellar biosynthesis protein FliQ [Methylotenera sp.]|jgi:flagellar biosynthetic protein FliQ|uniref:flagellar biosynthesis protein FliQ n=1 Tax=Methylotenera sp. TaxID=2051956 RepID=UPI002720DFD0|nr:flagellar biosynthesis protein FliQ [Methylotenera sp.]MDO9151649.1 flagellar biosynthesis protein FliQ [Methylotenera sp.]
MTPESVMTLGRDAMGITLMIAAPILLTVLTIGLLVSIFQAATQINEQTLSFIPKLVGVFVALMFAGPWMLTTMVDYMRLVFTTIPAMAN